MQFERLRRFSLEALLAWGFGLPIVSGLATIALVFAVRHFIGTGFDEYDHQDMPMMQFASNSQDDWLKVRRYEEHFLLSPGAAIEIGDAKAQYITLWKANLNDIRANLQKIRSTAGENDRAVTDMVSKVDASLVLYESDFNATVDSVLALGDENEGLEAAMTAKAEETEAALKKTETPLLMEHFLAMRRSQVDFILDGKESDAAGFAEEFSRIERPGDASQNTVQRQALISVMKDYASLFNRYVARAKNLASQRRNYAETARRLDDDFDQLQRLALQNAGDGLKRIERRVGSATAAIAFCSILFGIVIVAVVFIAVRVAEKIRNATRRIIGFAEHLAAGKLDTRLKQLDSGEFGALEAALNEMADRLQTGDDTMNRQATDLRKNNHRIALLSEMTGLLQTVVSMEEATEVVACHMAGLGISTDGGVYLYKESRNYLDILARWGETPLPDSFSPDDCWALRRGQPYGTIDREDRGAALVCSHAEHAGHGHPYLCLPMIARDGSFGLVHVVFRQEGANVTDEESQFVRRMAEQLSLALANVKLRETLREQSLSDALTGLFNRRYLQISLDREFARCAREKKPIAVLMLDVDHFKRFNDNHGHEAGDIALRLFGRLLKENCRGGDLACRFGGEEFTVILPGANGDEAAKWATRLMEKVRKMEISLHGQTLPYLTVSIGIALYPEHGEDVQAVLQAADLALYKAKHAGRDRYVIKAPEEESAAAETN